MLFRSEKMVVEEVKGAEVEVDDAATNEVLEGEDLQVSFSQVSPTLENCAFYESV